MNLVKKCFKGFLFDLDGTLVDTTELIRRSFRHVSREMLGEELPDEVLMANVGQPLMTQMQVLGGDDAQRWYDVYREYNHAVHDEYTRGYAGVRELLEELTGRGVGLAVVTSKSRMTVEMAFRCVPIEGFFGSIITADDTEQHKPNPQPLQLAMRRLDLVPEESVYIGDSPYDIEAGHAAGTATAAVGWGIFPPVRLKEVEPDFYFESPDEILGLCPASG